MAATTATLTYTQEFQTSLAPEKSFKGLIANGQSIVSKAIPQTIKSIEREAGGRRNVTFTNGAKLKLQIDSVDYEGLTCKFSFVGGEKLEGVFLPITNELKFLPSADGGSIITLKVNYPITDADTHYPAIKTGREKTVNMFKAAEGYVLKTLTPHA